MGLSFANKITVCRILMIPFFIVAVLSYTSANDYLRYVALGIFLFAVITDLLDGYVARTCHEKTQAGSILDPLADKLLLISAFSSLYVVGVNFENLRFPVWLVVSVVSRDVILLLGAMIIYLVRGSFQINPSFSGKAATFLQIVSVIGILLQWKRLLLLWSSTVLLTFISGLGYIYRGIRILNEGDR